MVLEGGPLQCRDRKAQGPRTHPSKEFFFHSAVRNAKIEMRMSISRLPALSLTLTTQMRREAGTREYTPHNYII